MLRRPRQFEMLAMLLVLIAASLPVQVMATYGFSPLEVNQILAGLAPMNWVVMIFAVIHAALVFLASPLVLATAPLFILVVAWNNWVVASVGLNVSTAVAIVATLGAIAAHVPLLDEAPRRVLLNPRLRWWRTAPRRRARVPATVRPVTGGEIRTCTFDVSEGGAFLSFDNLRASSTSLRQLKVGSRCSVRIVLDQLHTIQCGAEIVRHAQARGNYPGGFAVRFVCLDSAQRRALAEFVKAQAASIAAATVVAGMIN